MKGGRGARRQNNVKEFTETSGRTLNRGADMSETESSKQDHEEEEMAPLRYRPPGYSGGNQIV